MNRKPKSLYGPRGRPTRHARECARNLRARRRERRAVLSALAEARWLLSLAQLSVAGTSPDGARARVHRAQARVAALEKHLQRLGAGP